jgi:glycosyltransferase involved in cell wall biosynthesis
MKIWYVSKYAKSPPFGIPTRQFLLSKVFSKMGHETTLIFSRSNGGSQQHFRGLKRTEEIDGVHCVVLNGPSISIGFNIKRVFSWLIFEWQFLRYGISINWEERPDVLIASSLSLLTFFTSSILKKRFKCKLILEVRDIWPATVIESGKFSSKSIFIKFLTIIELFGYKRADGFVSTLPLFDEYLKTKIKGRHKFAFIPQGFDYEYYKSSVENKYKNEFPLNFFNVCYSGTIGKTNCVDEIIYCAELLKDRRIRFLIIGDGPLKKILETKYSSLTNIVFWDSVPKKEIVSILSSADLLLNLWNNYDIYRYGISPNKVVDYMLSGRPILISFSGYKGFLDDVGCAFFTEANNPKLLAEAILQISQMQPGVLDQMGERGKKYALSNLDLEILGRRFLDFIDEIIKWNN